MRREQPQGEPRNEALTDGEKRKLDDFVAPPEAGEKPPAVVTYVGESCGVCARAIPIGETACWNMKHQKWYHLRCVNVTGEPSFPPAPAGTAREFAIDICRELYDKFVMGGWQPAEAHDYVFDILEAVAAQKVREADERHQRHFDNWQKRWHEVEQKLNRQIAQLRQERETATHAAHIMHQQLIEAQEARERAENALLIEAQEARECAENTLREARDILNNVSRGTTKKP